MEHSAATHRAVLSDDAVTKMMSFLEPTEDRKAFLTCKTWSTCWRRRCRGLLRAFITPCGIAVRDGKLYVSELEGRRIQVFRLPDDMRGSDLNLRPRLSMTSMELLQTIPSPDGWPLGGLCFDDAGRLWCVGPGVTWMGPNANHAFDTTIHFDDPDAYLHVFEPCCR